MTSRQGQGLDRILPGPARITVTAAPIASASPRMQAAARYVWLLAALFPDEDLIDIDEADIPDLPPPTQADLAMQAPPGE
jgi:hypothetical protein